MSQAVPTGHSRKRGAEASDLPVRVTAGRVLRTITAVGAQAGEVLDSALTRYLPRVRSQRPLDADDPNAVETIHRFPPWTRWTFGLGVVLPTALSALYFFFFASNQYVAEARFAVRGQTQQLLSTGGPQRFGGGGALQTLIGLNTNQEVYIVTNYIQSPKIIDDLRDELDVRAMFAWPAGDLIAAFDPSGTREQLFGYWLKTVSAEVEAISGIATVKVTAFSPADSRRLADAILMRCERLVNDFVKRVRVDTLQRAEDDLRRAGERAAAARKALSDFRERHQIIDPTGVAASLFDTVTRLRQDLITAETELNAARFQLGDASPRIRELRARVQIMDKQIRELEARLTQVESNDPRKASEAIRAYELLQFDAKMADDVFALADSAFTDARANLEKRHIYLETYVRPTLPEEALYPHRLLGTLAVFAGAFMIWTLAVLGTGAIRDHVD